MVRSILIGLCIAGCAAPSATRPARTPRRVAADPGHIALVWIPNGVETRLVRRERGRSLVLAGPWRMLVEGRRASFSETRTTRPIESATECGANEWLFRTQDGLLLRSTTFLGELRTLGEVPPNAIETQTAPGRLVLAVERSEDDRIWIADCNGVREIRPGGGPVMEALFATPTFGVVRSWGGRLAITSDGGASFRPLPLDEHAATRLAHGPDGTIALLRTDGFFQIFEDGRMEPVTRDWPNDEEASNAPTRDELLAIARIVIARDPNLRDALPLAIAPPRVHRCPDDDDTDSDALLHGAVRVGPRSIAVWLGDAVTLFEGSESHTIALPQVSCPRLASIGGRAVIHDGASRRDRPARFYALERTRWERISAARLRDACEIAVSDDGQHVAYLESCRESRICVASIRDGSPHCTDEEDSIYGHIVSMHGDRALVFSRDNGGHFLIQPPGDVVEISEAGSEEVLVTENVTWSLGDDVIARVGERFYRGPPDEVRALELPTGVSGVMFAPGARGIAFAYRHLWLTENDGRTWTPARTQPGLQFSGQARCDARGCLVASELYERLPSIWITGFRAPRMQATAARSEVPETTEAQTASRYAALQCAPVGAPQNLDDDISSARGQVTSASIRLEWTLRGSGAARAELLRWRARTEHGELTGRGGILGAPEVFEDDEDTAVVFHPIAAIDDGLLVHRCADPDDEDRCTLHFVTEGRPMDASVLRAFDRVEALFTDDGSMTLFMGGEVVDFSSRLGWTMRRLHFDNREPSSAFGYIGGRLRLVQWIDEPAQVRLFDASPSTNEGVEVRPSPLSGRELHVCADRRPVDRDRFWAPMFDGIARVESDAQGLCVSAVRAPLVRDRLWLAARNGVLEGWERNQYDEDNDYGSGFRDQLQRVRCTIAYADE